MSGAAFTNEDGVLHFRGTMTLARLGDVVERVEAIDGQPKAVDLSGIERIDTVGAWIIHRLVRDHDIPVQGADSNTARLLEQVAAADRPCNVRPDHTPPFKRVLAQVGSAVY